jgi:hypothetical protein
MGEAGADGAAIAELRGPDRAGATALDVSLPELIDIGTPLADRVEGLPS